MNNLRFADDIVHMADRVDPACQLLQDLESSYSQVGLKVEVSKKEYMTNRVLTNTMYGTSAYL